MADNKCSNVSYAIYRTTQQLSQVPTTETVTWRNIPATKKQSPQQVQDTVDRLRRTGAALQRMFPLTGRAANAGLYVVSSQYAACSLRKT